MSNSIKLTVSVVQQIVDQGWESFWGEAICHLNLIFSSNKGKTVSRKIASFFVRNGASLRANSSDKKFIQILGVHLRPLRA